MNIIAQIITLFYKWFTNFNLVIIKYNLNKLILIVIRKKKKKRYVTYRAGPGLTFAESLITGQINVIRFGPDHYTFGRFGLGPK